MNFQSNTLFSFTQHFQTVTRTAIVTYVSANTHQIHNFRMIKRSRCRRRRHRAFFATRLNYLRFAIPSAPLLIFQIKCHRDKKPLLFCICDCAIPGFLILWAYSMMGKKLCEMAPPFDNNEGISSTQQVTKRNYWSTRII